MSSRSDDYMKEVKSGVRAVLNEKIPGMGISSRALRLVSECLSNVNSQLIDHCRKDFARRKNPSTMPVSVAQKAVTETLPRKLLPLAEEYASNCMVQYNTGQIQYPLSLKKEEENQRRCQNLSSDVHELFKKLTIQDDYKAHDFDKFSKKTCRPQKGLV